ncbi:tetratricopeptide repeat-containing sensor histidine kinase [Flavobacterium sp. YJ01]|uniref:tetratricopeptide repeat-containing sensor histidine kinase n=1 Tax=unclassified Flavobacterium TaxID=196869 RepID=UPI0023E357F9|nr:tetratricopeptide repeat-containing sensor histidine kinase [Flavobacterium sp. YJ01]WET01482.1 ATP-binding protein [Flavobacterium sp. YJ01]
MIPKRIPFSFYLLVTFLVLFSCQKKKNISEIKTTNKTEITRLIAIADTLFYKNKFDSAFYYYNEATTICSPSKDAENYISSLNQMAIIQETHGDYAGSEATITKALPYTKLVKNQLHSWNLYTTLGLNYSNTFDYKNALLYHQKALKLNVKPWKKLASKNNIAVTLIQSKKFTEALNLLLPLENKEEVIKDQEFYGALLDNIGRCYQHMDNYEIALDYMTRGLEVRKKLKSPFGMGESYIHLAELHELKNPSLAKKYMILSYKEFNKINHTEGRLSTLKMIIKNSSGTELKTNSDIYINLIDSTFEITQKAKNQFARIKYDSKREKEENLRLKTYKAENELKLERQKNRNIISYIIIVISLCLILILYYYLTSKANREKIEAEYNSETRISKKLHDELANDIYHTMAFAENRNLSITENKEQLLNNLDAIYSRTRDISKESCTIITDQNYIPSLKEMISGFSTLNINLILNGLDSISWDKVNKHKKITIYRVLQELLVNMRKYSEASVVGISFKQTEKNILVNYTDNGKGINTEKIIFKNGLYNVEHRIHKIKGSIDITSNPNEGFKVFIKLPI